MRQTRRVWVQNVIVAVRVLETRLDVAEAQGLGPDQMAAADGVRKLLRTAEEAAYGVEPRSSRLANWWGGTLVEAAYQNLHAARAQMVDVYDDATVAAEIPIALARSRVSLHRDDPRHLDRDDFEQQQSELHRRAFLRRAIKDGYDAMDRQHERLRSFRNINLLLALFIAVLVAITIAFVSARPSIMPLCFPASGFEDGVGPQNCPTGSGVAGPTGDDIIVVALLGLLGGALAAAVSIRNLRGTSTPYDVPVALAMLKVPLGAFTAILGLVAIQGNFIPGLSALDSQQQILAYALVLGFGQQVFTYSLDQRAQTLLDAVPAKDAAMAPPSRPPERPSVGTRAATLPPQHTPTAG
ncbi:MAG: hypothetical protein ACRDV2_07135, partial [Actinomycetes bacterium]